MKKTYIIPNVEVVHIETAKMLAGSLGSGNTPTVGFGSATDGYDYDDAD